MILGDTKAPWEDAEGGNLLRRIGPLSQAVLSLLSRDPAQRLTMQELQHACLRVLSHTTTTDYLLHPSGDLFEAYSP
jgi:hypothetical protein